MTQKKPSQIASNKEITEELAYASIVLREIVQAGDYPKEQKLDMTNNIFIEETTDIMEKVKNTNTGVSQFEIEEAHRGIEPSMFINAGFTCLFKENDEDRDDTVEKGVFILNNVGVKIASYYGEFRDNDGDGETHVEIFSHNDKEEFLKIAQIKVKESTKETAQKCVNQINALLATVIKYGHEDTLISALQKHPTIAEYLVKEETISKNKMVIK